MSLKIRHLFFLAVIFIGLVTIIASGGGGDGGSSGSNGGSSNNDDADVTTSITSGTAFASSKPSSTGSSDSPVINMISYDNVASPGSEFTGEIDFSDNNGDASEIIIAEQGVSKYNVISIDSSSDIFDGIIDFDAGLSDSLSVGESIIFYIGLRDDSDNVSNYLIIEICLSDEPEYSTTSYSGSSVPNVDGNWDVELTVKESNPVYSIGDVLYSEISISQSGNDLVITDDNGSYDGSVSGTDNYVTIIWEGTIDFNSQGADVYADFWGVLSGKIVSAGRIEGESNSIIYDVYGADADSAQVYSVACDVVLTKEGYSEEDEGRIEGQITYEGSETGWHALYVVIKNLDYSDVVSKQVSLFTTSEDSLAGYGFSYIFNEIPSGGPYYVFAYWDSNDNGYYDNDPAGYFQGAINVSSGSEEYNVDIELED